MRVISGTCRGMRLKSLSGVSTRPTTDRVKEALFSIIQPRVFGSSFLDLFAGNGGIGIEALSRQADKVVFVESNARCTKIIKENLSHTKVQGEVYTNDVFRALPILARKGRLFDLIFLDPPYGQGLVEKTVTLIGDLGILKPDGLLIAEYGRKEGIPKRLSNLSQVREERYGDTMLGFFQCEED